MELVDLREKSEPGDATSSWYNAGLYAFRPSIFEFTAKLKPSPRGEYELTDAIRELAQIGQESASARTNRRMGRCAGPGNFRETECNCSDRCLSGRCVIKPLRFCRHRRRQLQRMAIWRSVFGRFFRRFFADLFFNFAPPFAREPRPQKSVEQIGQEKHRRHPLVIHHREDENDD